MIPKIFRSDSPGRLVKATGKNPSIDKAPVQGHAFVPDPLPPKAVDSAMIGRLWEGLESAATALARLDGLVQSLPNPDLLLRPFRLREAKLSSRIENTFASVEEIALVDDDKPPRGTDVREVWNYLDALDLGLESDLPLGSRLFGDLHKVLLTDVRGENKTPGEFRRVQVGIGDDTKSFAEAKFVPPPPGEELDRCLRDFEIFLNPGTREASLAPPRQKLPPLVEIAMGHYQFETIHPFGDGNGRLGRLLIAISLCRSRMIGRPLVYVSAHFDRYRQTYYDLLLRVSTEGDWESWIRFFCEAVSTQAQDGMKRAIRLSELRGKYIQSVSGKRVSALVPRIVDMLFVRPGFDISSLARRLDISVGATQKHVGRLFDAKIIREVTGGNYARQFVATEIVKTVEQDDVD